VVTRRELLDRRADGASSVRELLTGRPAVAFESSSLREAADLMVTEGIGRLPVVSQSAPRTVIGMLTRSDLLSAHARRLNENDHIAPSRLPLNRKRPRKAG
jgi:CBS domain-containing protein